jgi:hypothetical protein
MKELLNEPTYNVLKKDPTNKIERKTAAPIIKLDIAGDVTKRLIPSASVPPSLLNIQKIDCPSATHSELHWLTDLPLCAAFRRTGQPTSETYRTL